MNKMGTLFDLTPRDYDAVRPGYPAELVEDVIAISAIPARGRILEIGCGTGQATLPFAERGYTMLCLDIGQDLAAITAEKCRPYPAVSVQTISFEDWQPQGQRFDLLISATAFHWIRPEIGFPKAAQILKDSGSIALFWNLHPPPFTGFFEAVQPVYRRIVPEWDDPTQGPSTEARIRAREAQINDTGLFEPARVRQYPWTRSYPTQAYLRLLNTYSPHLALDEERRQRLFDEIGELIDREFDGVVARPYLSVLYIAQKTRPS